MDSVFKWALFFPQASAPSGGVIVKIGSKVKHFLASLRLGQAEQVPAYPQMAERGTERGQFPSTSVPIFPNPSLCYSLFLPRSTHFTEVRAQNAFRQAIVTVLRGMLQLMSVHMSLSS